MEPRSWLTPKRRCAVTCVRSHTSRESGVEAELLEHDYSLFFAFFSPDYSLFILKFSVIFVIHFIVFMSVFLFKFPFCELYVYK